MSETPTNNLKIAYSDDINPSTEQIEFVKQSEAMPGNEEGQYVYTMPSAFRFGPKTNTTSKMGLLIMGLGIILLIGLVYVGFLIITKKPVFNFNSTPVDNGEVISATSNPPVNTSPAVATTSEVVIDLSDPEQAYLQLRLKLDQALTLEDYFNIFIAGASQGKAQELMEQTMGLDQLSESQKSSTLSISKSMLIPLEPTDHITKEINGDQATLTITKADSGRVGVVTMLLEEGQWRLDDEHWQDEGSEVSTTPETVGPEATETSMVTTTEELLIEELALDSDLDQDGLTDKEEALLGTKSDIADSDSDGYDDLGEIKSGYDPASRAKLVDNRNLKIVQQGPWSVLVPTMWTQQLGRDNSAIFRADDGQFIQLTIMDKVAGQGLASWYQQAFNVEQIPEITVKGSNEVGLSPDGLTYYITRPEFNDLIALTYNPEVNHLLSYNNIFHLMIDNLTIQ